MAFKVGLLGLGTVGTGTVKILLDPAQRNPLLKDVVLHRVGVRSLHKPREVDLPPDCLTTDLAAIVSDPEVDIVVELIGGIEPARSLILEAIDHRKHVVTANKALIALHGEEIFEAAAEAGVYVLLEAAVGGGIPVIEPLKQSLCANRIQSISGIVNGTTNYILTRMQKEGGSFLDMLEAAQHLGYAEADPTADVDGWDAADKIAILASLAFGERVRRSEVYSEGIRQVTTTDILYADRLGFVIKLLALAHRVTPPTAEPDQPHVIDIRVHPTLVAKGHPLASVNGVYNAILVEGDPIGQVMFYGPGAGAGPTASAVMSDVLNIAALLTVERGNSAMVSATVSAAVSAAPRSDAPPVLDPLLACTYHRYCTIASMEETHNRFYARLQANDQPGVIGQLGTCFGQHGVSLESVVQLENTGDRATIVVVTHEVREGDFWQAIGDITALDCIDEVANVLRVL
ncbi:homoserine dehydrogenase [Prochlorothrix hollandica]|uniref:Homoserine dehydrogenase n=1 Tax=Prochlorothrix hollandica PCC 9006 = CALU 1027 TaxID=317619 RepID=A0A0M2PX82_PROHO|nr:homoserine dehydrogenase [Prochlorothrix hollandica]KKI99278.1 homoserine dehydrogenase [Prochlorothrix hollandica PCC 9006 = CALU 1027]